MPKRTKPQKPPDVLKGWHQISAFLGQPVAVAQRYTRSGIPAECKGRNVYASREELNRWLAGESAGEPGQIVTDETDLSAQLRRGLSFLRKRSSREKPAA